MPIKTWSSRQDIGGLYRASGAGAWKPYGFTYWDVGSLVSINHRMPITGRGDVGGPFLLNEESWDLMPMKVDDNLTRGTILPTITQSAMSDPAWIGETSDSALDAAGTTAIARCEPTNPTFSAATFIGEAREGAPSAIGLSTWRNKTNVARSAGSEYLNVEFGWKPLVSDLQKFATAVDDSHMILEAYHEGSGKKIRTGYSFGVSGTPRTYTTAGNGIITTLAQSYLSAPGSIVDSVTTERWFEGAFRYYLPVPDTQRNKFRNWASDARKLYGLEITPEVVWNISPWTWAADWFANTGDVLHNIAAFSRDGLVMQYGYIMERQTHVRQIMCARYGRQCMITRTRRRLKRRPATPFGFGVNLSALTSRQSAVLVALGLSRH
jgi:hypothetical protein